MIAAATEVCNANSEWLTNVAAGDDNNGCYHAGLQLQRTTAMVTAEACDGCFVLRTIPTREPSLVAVRAHDACRTRAAE